MILQPENILANGQDIACKRIIHKFRSMGQDFYKSILVAYCYTILELKTYTLLNLYISSQVKGRKVAICKIFTRYYIILNNYVIILKKLMQPKLVNS